ncbi:hypothetical protein RvY_17450 [Ramazzottius varieornatus]|uniref:Hexosyltransferase n=1 Tax=Ramazzottius varieornatus TaxID=947166 RepID=A0A1D1W257_RAMVA|nr:hypothetical protein RvY_17450 [Ramazzottius varieornatus]
MRFGRTCDILFRVVIGTLVAYLTRLPISSNSSSCPNASVTSVTSRPHLQERQWQPEVPPEVKPRRLLFVGVMTAQKYLDNRAASVYHTWGQKLPPETAQIAFFSSAGSVCHTDPNLPLVALPGVDDSYPPQKKSFLMLKYMNDHFIDDFEWFMRADDDVFVRGDRLEEFLRSLNSSKPLFIGQAGMGNKEEFGMLSLSPGENFCMGGPGIIISREVLRRMAPHMKYCLKHLLSTHEDVEVGRCIGKFAGVPCAWSYEMQTIFYHNGSGAAAFTGDLHSKQVHRAITLHPVKTSEHLYRIQNYYNALKLLSLRHEILKLRREVSDMNSLLYPGKSDPMLAWPTLNRFRPESAEQVLEWEFFTKSLFSHLDFNPKRAPRSSLKWAQNDLTMQMMDSLNQYSQQRGRVIDFRELLYGFQRLDPLHGVHYVLDLHLVYRRYSGKKMTAPVRRHAYLEQSFSSIDLVEEVDCVGTSPFPPNLKRDFGRLLRYHTDLKKRQLDSTDPLCSKLVRDEQVNFVVPISGRYATYLRFIKLMEDVCFSTNQSVSLTIVSFVTSDNSETFLDTEKHLESVRRRYPQYDISLLRAEGNFSRAKALHLGSQRFANDSLLFFVDVDMAFDVETLSRIRKSTKMGRMVYYPIVFSQYDPSTWSTKDTSVDHFHLTQDSGYWRQFGYGIASMYRADFERVGGFDQSIYGWGKEDVDLFEKYIKEGEKDSRFAVFRAVDPTLVHIYHPIHCDAKLDSVQLTMCLGTKAASLASESVMTRYLMDNPSLLHTLDKP